jgi:hypothetical protein
MTSTEEARRRGCYCELWDTDSQVYESRGLPRGYCGFCERCGQPGHVRHFPGSVPYTGSWCDAHYRRLVWTDLRSPNCVMVLAIVLGGFAALLRWWGAL